jgi:hypothetical protein
VNEKRSTIKLMKKETLRKDTRAYEAAMKFEKEGPTKSKSKNSAHQTKATAI